MALRISAKLKKAIQDELKIEKSEVEDHVWNQKDQHCFLCSAALNRSSDSIELDHDLAAAEGGDDSFSNLNLTHTECNRYKRNHSTFDVRPHLQFKRFWEAKSGAVNFREVLGFYDIKAEDIFLKVDTNKQVVKIEQPSGKSTSQIFKENVDGKDQLFCFVKLDVSVVENDDEIQPRNIKLNHLLSIASDLQRNPLHEQPACRIVGSGDKKRMLMFDGQHKTVANLINGNQSLVFKIYLNIETPEAIHLVNSIQSRIKKLPLTPFELATKMSDEFARKLETYEQEEGSTDVSEDGFVKWLDAAERSRAKKGIESAVIDRIISDDNLEFSGIIERQGRKKDNKVLIKEGSFQKNVLKILLYTKPLSDQYKGEVMKIARERESRNVIRLLNLVYDRGFVAQADKDPVREESRIQKLRYQGSLSYMSKVFKQLGSRLVMPLNDDTTFFEREFSDENWASMAEYVDNFFSHPVWITDLSKSGRKGKAVEEALSKNQNIEEAFRNVSLTPGYCGGLDKVPSTWAS